MRNAIFGLLGILTIAILGLLLFVTQPWSDYSPLAMNSLFAPDKRVENFRQMERVFPYRTVKAAAAPFSFPRAEQPLEVTYNFNGEQRNLNEFLERVTATGLLVIQNGRIVNEQYFQGADAQSRFTSWSVAKSFVSTLVGMALDEGKIKSIDDPITRYVPSLAGSGYNEVPIRHVLQMASGVKFDEIYGDQFSDINLFFYKTLIFGQRADDVMAEYGRARPSGEVFHYISINTQALGMLLRAVYDKPLDKLLEEKLWQPLGMEGDALWNVDSQGADGVALAFCCLNAQLRDYAKLGQLYLQQGRWQGEQLIPQAWVQEATKPGAAFLEPGASPYDYGQRGYQYQWWVPPNYEREYFAAGVWGQYIYVSEIDNLVITRTSVDPDFRENMAETIAVFRAIRDALRE